MPMKSKDIIAKKKMENLNAMAAALKSGDEDQLAQALANFAASVEESVIADAHAAAQMENQDTAVLASRGARQLTSDEKRYYNALAKAHRDNLPRQSMTGTEYVQPESIMDAVMDDLKKKHPLLDKIKFTNTYGAHKLLINKQGAQTAIWGKLTAAITKELEGAFEEVDMTLCKLTAYMPLSKDLIDLGPYWMDSYVREILVEASALALEMAAVDGDGDNKPTGMTRDMSADASVVNNVRPKMTAIAITDLTPTTCGMLVAKIARDPLTEDAGRTVDDIVLIVNPLDYWGTVMPATTYLLATGEYVNNVLPIKAEIIQSNAVTVGEAVIGMASKNCLGIGMAKDGRIENDDSVHFLEDERIYTTKMYGNGFPLDEYAFLLLDITELTYKVPEVDVTRVQGVVTTVSEDTDDTDNTDDTDDTDDTV